MFDTSIKRMYTGGHMEYQERIQSLDKHIANGTLVRNAWTGEVGGRETACLLAAMSPEAGAAENPAACPADVMPKWLAHLTPHMDDFGSAEAWPAMVRKYAAVAARWHVLSDETWGRLDYSARRIALKQCREHSPEVCDRVIGLCRRAESGDMPSSDEWSAAGAAAARAWETAEAAARVARARASAEEAWAEEARAEAAWAAAEAARAGATRATRAAWAAARARARWAAARAEAARAEAAEATRAARAAEAARWAARAVGGAESRAAWDSMTDEILSEIESACEKAEKSRAAWDSMTDEILSEIESACEKAEK